MTINRRAFLEVMTALAVATQIPPQLFPPEEPRGDPGRWPDEPFRVLLDGQQLEGVTSLSVEYSRDAPEGYSPLDGMRAFVPGLRRATIEIGQLSARYPSADVATHSLTIEDRKTGTTFGADVVLSDSHPFLFGQGERAKLVTVWAIVGPVSTWVSPRQRAWLRVAF